MQMTAGGVAPPASSSNSQDAFLPPPPRVLPLRHLGGADAQLPPAAPDAGRPDRLRPPASLAVTDPVDRGDHRDLQGAGGGRRGLDRARVLGVSAPRRPFRLR